MRKWIALSALVLLTSAFLAPSAGTAQQRRGSYIELDALIVEGRIQRPQAVYIIQRASLDFGAQAKRKSFVTKITESIRHEPF